MSCPLPKNSTPLSALGLDFRPFGPHAATSPNSLHFPHRGLDKKTLIVPIFGAKECIKMQDFVFKMCIFLNSGVTPRREGIYFLTPTHPVPTCQMLGPSASSRLATALVGGGVCLCVWGDCYHDNSKLRLSILTKLGL